MKKRLAGRFVVVGLHPAIDRTIQVRRLRSGGVIRGRLVMVEAAGKGMNITRTLSALGRNVLSCGFLGRVDADLFRSSLRAGCVTPRFVEIAGATRQNITIIEQDKRADMHILSGNMRVRRKDLDALLAGLQRDVGEGDWTVFAGSRPAGVRQADYVRALRTCRRRGARLAVDAAGPMLRAALREGPWLIKPNRAELEELVGRRLRTRNCILDAARGLLDNCEHVLVSLGAEGALLVTRGGAWQAKETRRARVVHTVGCGDVLLAGFLSAYAAGRTPAEALRLGVACGSACVRSRSAAITSRRDPNRFLPRIHVSNMPAKGAGERE